MRYLNDYIIEKLKINKNTKIEMNNSIKNFVSEFFSREEDDSINYSIEIRDYSGMNVDGVKDSYTIDIYLKCDKRATIKPNWYKSKKIIDFWCRELSKYLEDNLDGYEWYSRSTVEKDNRISISISKKIR